MTVDFDDLWSRYLEGELDEGGMAELSRMLDEDPKRLAQAADSYELHRLLGFICRGSDDKQFIHDTLQRIETDADHFVASVRASADRTHRPARWRVFRPRTVSVLGIVGAALAAFLLGRYLPISSDRNDRTPPPVSLPAVVTEELRSYAATLIAAADCRWVEGQAFSPGERLLTGSLRLEQGTALLRFDGGAMVAIRGPSAIDLDSPGSATLLSGSATVRSADEAAGFILRTKTVDVVDIGTEFHVTAKHSGATEIHVLEGGVEWQKRSSTGQAGPRVLSEGEALRFDAADGFSGRSVVMSASRFAEIAATTRVARDDGKVLAYEGFDNAKSHQDARGRPAGGFGWSRPWGRAHHDQNLPAVASFWNPESLLGPSGMPVPIGGRVDFPAGEHTDALFAAYTRKLSVPVDLSANDAVYFSFLLRRSDVVFPNDKPDYQWFRAILTSPSDIKTRIGVGMSARGEPMIYGPTGNAISRVPLPARQTYLFVAKIVTGRDRPDQVFLQVYGAEDTLPDVEPVHWTVAGRIIDRHSKLPMLHLYNGLSRQYSLDEIRFATSWRAAVGK
jgi:hypothetical protein